MLPKKVEETERSELLMVVKLTPLCVLERLQKCCQVISIIFILI